MNKITSTKNNSETQSQQKCWKAIGFKDFNKKEEISSLLHKKLKYPPLQQKRFSVFFDQIHKHDKLEQQLKQSQVIQVQEFCRNTQYKTSPINSLLDSKVKNGDLCGCKMQIKKINEQLQKFKKFHADVQKRSRVINSMLQVMSCKQKKPQLVQQIFQKLYKEIYQLTNLNQKSQLIQNNIFLNKKVKQLEQSMKSMIQKNVQLENKMEYYQHQLSQVQKSRQSSQITVCPVNRSRFIDKPQRYVSKSIQPENSKELTFNSKNICKLISPKPNKRFVRSTSRTIQPAEIHNYKLQNNIRFEKKIFSTQLRNNRKN